MKSKTVSKVGYGERLIFVGGAPRSGTSLLQIILDSHPDIFGGPEFDQISGIISLRNAFHTSVSTGRIDVFCNIQDVDEAFRSLIEGLLLPVAKKNGCNLLSEKTPMNVLVFADLLEIFPAARFIHVVRDPRAVVSSMLQVAERYRSKGEMPPPFIASIENAINTTREYASAGFKATRLAPDRVWTIVYEKLVADPEKETKALCDYLGIPWSDQMIYPGRKKHAREKLLEKVIAGDNGMWLGDRQVSGDPDCSSVEKWRFQLTPAQQEMIISVFRENEDYLRLEYDFTEPSIQQPQNDRRHRLIEKGSVFLAEENYFQAKKIFQTVQDENPISQDALFGLGVCARKQNKYEAALAHLEKLLDINPNHANAYNQIGLIASETGDLEGARTLFATAVEKEPGFLDAQRNFAECLLLMEEYDNAVQAYVTILDNHPEDVSSLLRMAQLNDEAGQSRDAIKWAERVLACDPQNPSALEIVKPVLN
ncbi:sulfotransferase [Caldithrix abyssi]|nr:sulfotransferase [Caldithrix abyssi]